MSVDAAPLETQPLTDFDELRRSLVVGYVVTAITAVVAVLVVRTDRGNVGLLSVAGFELGIAAFLAIGRSLPVWVIRLSAFAVAVGVVSAVVAFANPMGPAPLYYIWPALTCGHYGTRNDARLMMVFFAITFGLALGVAHDPQVPVITYVSMLSIAGLVLAVQHRDYARMRELTRQLADAAATDGLTRLINRRAFTDAFAREVERACLVGLPLSLIVFDLDHFKQLNDRFGHAAGDDALCAFSSILREQWSAGDVVARIGGEEFAVVLFDTDFSGAQDAVDRIAQSLRHWSLASPMILTTSAGIASLGPGTSSPLEMLVAADRALYVAKDAGRNRVAQVGDRAARELAPAA